MKTNTWQQQIMTGAIILAFTATVYGSACTHQGAAYSNCTKACKSCSTGAQVTGGTACACSKSDALIYCDCVQARDCATTGVNAGTNTHSCGSTGATCAAGNCPFTFPDVSTCPLVGAGTKITESTTCS